MERKEILDRLVEICWDVFEDENLTVTEETTAADVEGWDSLAHLSLINELMIEYGVTLTLDEINKSKNIGELITAVMKHLTD